MIMYIQYIGIHVLENALDICSPSVVSPTLCMASAEREKKEEGERRREKEEGERRREKEGGGRRREKEGEEGDRGKRESAGTIFRVCRRSAPHTVGHTTSNH